MYGDVYKSYTLMRNLIRQSRKKFMYFVSNNKKHVFRALLDFRMRKEVFLMKRRII